MGQLKYNFIITLDYYYSLACIYIIPILTYAVLFIYRVYTYISWVSIVSKQNIISNISLICLCGLTALLWWLFGIIIRLHVSASYWQLDRCFGHVTAHTFRPWLDSLTLGLLPVSLSGVQVNFEGHGGKGPGVERLDQRDCAHSEGGTEGDLAQPASPPPGWGGTGPLAGLPNCCCGRCWELLSSQGSVNMAAERTCCWLPSEVGAARS